MVLERRRTLGGTELASPFLRRIYHAVEAAPPLGMAGWRGWRLSHGSLPADGVSPQYSPVGRWELHRGARCTHPAGDPGRRRYFQRTYRDHSRAATPGLAYSRGAGRAATS